MGRASRATHLCREDAVWVSVGPVSQQGLGDRGRPKWMLTRLAPRWDATWEGSQSASIAWRAGSSAEEHRAMEALVLLLLCLGRRRPRRPRSEPGCSPTWPGLHWQGHGRWRRCGEGGSGRSVGGRIRHAFLPSWLHGQEHPEAQPRKQSCTCPIQPWRGSRHGDQKVGLAAVFLSTGLCAGSVCNLKIPPVSGLVGRVAKPGPSRESGLS